MLYILTKYSGDGGKYVFTHRGDLESYLYDLLCNTCIDEHSLSSFSDYEDMLNCPCGAEFDVEVEE